MPSVVRITRQGKVKDVRGRALAAAPDLTDRDTMIPLIQALIPLGLQAFAEVMQAEVAHLAGGKYSHTGGQPGVVRWGQQRGSIFLADQKVPVPVQRVRGPGAVAGGAPGDLPGAPEASRGRCRALFPEGAPGVELPGLRGLRRGRPGRLRAQPLLAVSRRFIRASTKRLQALQERRLEDYDLVALLLDGKTFAADSMVIALGITLTGEKVVLGFVQTATENIRVCRAFLQELVDRGLRMAQGLLVVLDGANGSGRRWAPRSAPRPRSNAVSGTSGRMSSPTCRRDCRIPGGGSSRPPTNDRPMRRRRRRWAGSGPSCAS